MAEKKKHTFVVHYGFDIKSPKAVDLAYYERDSFELEGNSITDFDTDLIKQKILQMANAKCKKGQDVIYANYHRIEKKPKRRKK